MAVFMIGDRVFVKDYDTLSKETQFGVSGSVIKAMQGRMFTICESECGDYKLSEDPDKYWWPGYALQYATEYNPPHKSDFNTNDSATLVVPAVFDPTKDEKPRWPFFDSVSILGSVYSIQQRTEEQEPRLENSNGFTDWTTKTIVLRNDIEGNLGSIEEYAKKVLRHEITHAFIVESGLSYCVEAGPWADSEEAVDWIAWQGPKLVQAWKEAGCM